MTPNLDTLFPEIHDALTSRGLVVFHSEMRGPELPTGVYWDIDQHPSYEQFLDAAVACGAKIITLFSRQFREEQVDDGLEQLEESELDGRDRHVLEKRLRDLRIYQGRMCQIELAFTHDGREYVFDVHASWFDEYGDLMDRIETAYLVPEDDSPLDGGYYSQN